LVHIFLEKNAGVRAFGVSSLFGVNTFLYFMSPCYNRLRDEPV